MNMNDKTQHPKQESHGCRQRFSALEFWPPEDLGRDAVGREQEVPKP